ncbi:MOSC beta barrel domain-containing protein isoform 2 [Cladophialophora immunda]|nr:MOSC beta barrel domain-containing protein isoform 2 [Cladophialophora immunda]
MNTVMDQAAIIVPPILLAVALICIQEAWNMRLSLQGYKKLKLGGPSHISDEEMGDKYAKFADAPSGSVASKWKVKALFIHPIKSCAGVELDVADVHAAGFRWDRTFAFAELLSPQGYSGASQADKGAKWVFRTLRQPGWERLALIKPEIWFPDPTDEEPSTDRGWMVVRYPRIPTGRFSLISRLFIWLGIASEGKSFRVPLVPGENHQYPTENVTVWKDNPKWLNYGVHLPNDFQSFIKASNPVTLFRVDPNAYREVFRCAPRKDQLGYQPVVGFADAYPVHLLNTTSVRDIALRVKQEIPRFTARRFRANILIDGPGAYNEDDWKMIRIGSHIFFCACHTVRCRLPNVDPDTAVMHPVEPDKTLKSFRCIDEGDPLNACLGLQLVPAAAGSFRIHVGDEVEVLERGHHKYIKQ